MSKKDLDDLKNKLNHNVNKVKDSMEGLRNLPIALQDAISKIKVEARNAGVDSQMPGREAGPADAYRHMIWIGSLAERFGGEAALMIGNMHEFQGNFTGQTQAQKNMDLYNNPIAASIGDAVHKSKITPQEAQELYQQAIIQGSETTPDGLNANSEAATWLPSKEWRDNPKYDIDSRVPPELRDKEMPLDQMNWPQDKIDWDNPYHNNPYIPTPPAKSEQPGKDDGSRDSSDASPAPKTVREELEAQFSNDKRKQDMSGADIPHPDEIDPATGKKFKDMKAGEYAAALYRRKQGQTANQNTPQKADNDNRPANAGGEVRVHAYDREGGKEHVRAHTRHKPA